MTTVSGACGDARCFRLNQLIKVMMALWTGLVTAAGGRRERKNAASCDGVKFSTPEFTIPFVQGCQKKNSYIVVACDLWRTHT
jgi:hypothetical protein